MKNYQNRLVFVLTIYISFVFIQSLFFKFTNSIETQYIFGTLDAWATTWGAGGIFSQRGVFSQYVIGTAELLTSTLLLVGLYKRQPFIQALGALGALAVISGAIIFHLFTPLGVNVLGDHGLLFGMACGVWIAAAIILYTKRSAVLSIITLRRQAHVTK